MLPEGWKRSAVGVSCAIRNNLRMPLSTTDRSGMKGPYPYFGPTGQLDSIDHYRIDMPFALIGEDGDHFLKHDSRPMTLFFEGKANVNNHAHVIADSETCLAKWFYYCFMHRDLTPVLTRQGVGRYKLTKAGLEQLEIVLPPLEEQRQIVRRLEVWDDAIAIAERLLTNCRRQRDALSGALLSGRKRLVETDPWKSKKLGELIAESRLPGSTGAVAKKLTVKLYGKGVVAKDERRIGSESTTYYRRRAGQFIYSKLDFLNGAFGLIPQALDGYESTLDLPAFDLAEDVDPSWLLHYVSREDFYVGHLGLANGGRKARRVNPSDLLKVSIQCPSIEEQRAIAHAVHIAAENVRHWESSCSLLKAEKRALMADLLTGKRRVRLAAAEATP